MANLTVKALPTLPITLPTAAIPAGVLTQTVTLPALPLLDPLNLVLNLLLPSRQLTIDLKPAVDALLPNGRLPTLDPFSVGAATAFAGASCRSGQATQFGLTQVADARRLVVTSLTAKGGRVRIAGRVGLPLARPAARITLTRRVSCKKSEVVRRFRTRADGTFSVTVAAPDDTPAAV